MALTCANDLPARRTPRADSPSTAHSVRFIAGRTGLAVVLAACIAFASALAGADAALAAAAHASLDGKSIGLIWILPFVGILLSIAVFPLAAPHFWHHHYGKVAAFWAIALIIPFLLVKGFNITFHEVMHTLLLEYIPFIVLIGSLFTVAGGIYIRGNLHGSPATNTSLLAIGAGIASFVGTTGASMLLIRPVIRANDDRKHSVHVFVFFIFLVSNIGGSLTPLGDPPLFLGFLQGVDFFWTAIHLWQPMLIVCVILLAAFYALDSYFYAKEGHLPRDPTPDSPIRLEGKRNFILLAVLIAFVLWSGLVKSLGTFTLFGIPMDWKNVVRDLGLVGVAIASMMITPRAVREANSFNWGPALEVAKLFAGIFITIIPAIAILKAGSDGALSGLLNLVTTADGKPNNAMYFWLTGGLSSFLDNAPTYLVFFNAAGGNAQQLMGPLAQTLMAISLGAVFMGANTYIGNAPNFMVKAIVEDSGTKMPSFFGYMAWSIGILVPCFVLVHLIFL